LNTAVDNNESKATYRVMTGSSRIRSWDAIWKEHQLSANNNTSPLSRVFKYFQLGSIYAINSHSKESNNGRQLRYILRWTARPNRGEFFRSETQWKYALNRTAWLKRLLWNALLLHSRTPCFRFFLHHCMRFWKCN
jgi:hypothetical protein